MPSPTANTTLPTYRRRTDVPGYNRNRSYGPAPSRLSARPNAHVPQRLTKPVQLAPSRDFHLDTFFNPVWMSGLHTFSFAEDGKAVRPEADCTESYPGYRGRVASSLGRNVHSAALPSPSPSFPRAHASKVPRRVDKPWKNVAISEQDDAEFVAMEVEAKKRARAEGKGKLIGLVYTWPPKPKPAACAECEALAGPRRSVSTGVWLGVEPQSSASTGTSMGAPESAVPSLSYGSSGESESESEVFRVVPGRKFVARRKEVPLEKSVGFGRVQRKAPAPLSLARMDEGEGESGWTLSETPREVGECHGSGDGIASPSTPAPWVEDQLTLRLKALLKMPKV